MATLTPLAPDAQGTVTGVTDQAGGTTNLHTVVTDGLDTTYLHPGIDSGGEILLRLSDVNSDFGSMDTLAGAFRVRLQGTVTDDTTTLFAQVFDGNATTTALTNEVTVATHLTAGATFNLKTPAFTIQGTPTKAQWNNAYLRLRWTYTKTKASDGIEIRVSEAHLTGTYTVGSATLVVADSAHAHAVDNVALTQAHALVADGGSHGHQADGLTLTESATLTVGDGVHGHQVDVPTLTEHSALVAVDANHAHSADSPTLTQAYTLAVADSAHAHTADSPTPTVPGSPEVGDVKSSLTAKTVSSWFGLGDTIAVGDTIVAFATHRTSAQAKVNPVHIDAIDIPTVQKIEDQIGNTSARRAIYVCAKVVTAEDITAWGTSPVLAVDFDTTVSRTVCAYLIEGEFDPSTVTVDTDSSGTGQANSLTPGPLVPGSSDTLAAAGLVLRHGDPGTVAFSDSYASALQQQDGALTANGLVGASAVKLVSASTSTTISWTTAEESTAVLALFEQPGSGVTLVVAAATHAHSVDSPTLSQAHVLVVASATHIHSADEPTLTTAGGLEVHSATHGHTVDNATISTATYSAGSAIQSITVSITEVTLVVDDAIHSHVVESPTLTQAHDLVVNNSSHGHSVDSPTLAQAHVLAASAVSHSHESDNPTLTQAHTLASDDSSHGHTADNAAITVHVDLVVEDTLHGHTSENSVLDQAHALSVDSAIHAHTADLVAATTDANLGVNGATHGHVVDSLTLTQAHELLADAATHDHVSDSPTLSVKYTLSVDSSTHAHDVSQASTTETLDTLVAVADGDGSTHQPREWATQSFSDVNTLNNDSTVAVATFGTTCVTSFALPDMPADFASIESLEWRFRHRSANRIDDTISVLVKIIDGSDGTLLAYGPFINDFDLVTLNATGTFFTYGPGDFSILNESATKDQWDNAVVLVRQTYVVVGASDGAFTGTVLSGFDFNGTYTTPDGEITLTQHHVISVADTAHAHSVDEPLLSVRSTLAVDDSSHGQTSEFLSLSQEHLLAVDDSIHEHEAESVAISSAANLSVASSAHGHSVDNVTLTQAHAVQVDEPTHSHTADEIAITTNTGLAVDDASHEHSSDAVLLGQAHSLSSDDSTHLHNVDDLLLFQVHGLDVESSDHVHSVDALELDQAHTLTSDDALHSHAADVVGLSSASELSVAAASHGHVAQEPVLVQAHNLLVEDSIHDHSSDNAITTASPAVQGSVHAHSPDSPTLTQAHTLSVEDAVHGQDAGEVSLTSAGSLSVDSSIHTHTTDNIDLSQNYVLALDDAAHDHVSDAPTLSASSTLSVDDGLHGMESSETGLSQAHSLVLEDAGHDHEAETPTLQAASELAVDSAIHAHVANELTIVDFAISVENATHLVSSTNVALGVNTALVVASATHTHTAGTMTLLGAVQLIQLHVDALKTRWGVEHISSTLSVSEVSPTWFVGEIKEGV